MPQRLSRCLVVAGCFMLTVATVGWADDFTVCTSGSFRSCHSIGLSTTALLASDGVTRIGTAVTISLSNLGGQNSEEEWSGLNEVVFEAKDGTPELAPRLPSGGFQRFTVPLLLSGGASGSATWWVLVGPQSILVDAFQPSGQGSPYLLGGCGAGTSSIYGSAWATSAYTCTPGAVATISFSLASIFAESQLSFKSLDVLGQLKGDPTTYDAQYTTPEPGTLALFATGLVGLTASRIRRRGIRLRGRR